MKYLLFALITFAFFSPSFAAVGVQQEASVENSFSDLEEGFAGEYHFYADSGMRGGFTVEISCENGVRGGIVGESGFMPRTGGRGGFTTELSRKSSSGCRGGLAE